MATPSVKSEEIPKSQAKINEELFRFQVEMKSELARAKMKLDLLIAMVMENRKSKAEDQPQTNPNDGILFTPPSSSPQLVKPEYEALFEQDACEVEHPILSKDLHLDNTIGDVQLFEEQQVYEDDCSSFGKMFVQTGACNVFDEMSNPNPCVFLLEMEHSDTNLMGNVKLNEIQEVFAEMPEPVTTIQESFYVEYLVHNKLKNKLIDEEEQQHPLLKMDCLKAVRNLEDEMTLLLGAVVMKEQLIDPYIRGTNFNNITLFDPGGDSKLAMTSSVENVPDLFGKAHGTCANGLEGVACGKIVMKNVLDMVLEEMPHSKYIGIQGAKDVSDKYGKVVLSLFDLQISLGPVSRNCVTSTDATSDLIGLCDSEINYASTNLENLEKSESLKPVVERPIGHRQLRACSVIVNRLRKGLLNAELLTADDLPLDAPLGTGMTSSRVQSSVAFGTGCNFFDRVFNNLFRMAGDDVWKVDGYCSPGHLTLKLLGEFIHLSFDPGGMWENGQNKADGERRQSKFLVCLFLSFWFFINVHSCLFKISRNLCPSQYSRDFAFRPFAGNAHMKNNSFNETVCGFVWFLRQTFQPSSNSNKGGQEPCLTIY